ncbi:MAG: fructose-6-phosphate aldolase [Deltaproteobacteria bacterium]|nr:MAG: fructose-6-phosphate aldolase [Deltaproteobacteria bacterium]
MTTRWPATALVALGCSSGPRLQVLELAARMLDAAPGVRVSAGSRVHRSAPMGSVARGVFYNAVLRVETTRSPRGLLSVCQDIERRLGRRRGPRWGDRRVDLDLLVHGDRVRRGRDLTLPHPGLATRDFVLVPAIEVAPDLVHPGLGLPLGALPPPSIRTGLTPVAASVFRGGLAAGSGLQYTAGPNRRRQATTMKIFLDTANLDEIRQARDWGIIDGVTTNPSLIAREGGDFVETIYQICEIVQGPVSAETVATDWQGMVNEGRLLARISEHVVVKIPLTMDGIRATGVLADEGIDVNVTLCFQASQALLAAKAGAAYISPFVGRLDDISTDGVALIESIVQMYANYPELGTEVLAASIRHPMHVVQVALAGADVATVPFKTLQAMIRHPLTDVGLERFLADWSTVPDTDIAGQVERWLQGRGAR